MPDKHTDPPAPTIYFDANSSNYWMELVPGRFTELAEKDVKRHLMLKGIHVNLKDDIGLTEGGRIFAQCQVRRCCEYAGPLAGHKVGSFKTSDGRLVLVTSPSTPIEPKRGPCDRLERFLGELLGDEQSVFFLAWLKVGYESQIDGDFKPGQLLALFGKSGCGKSLLQSLITEFFGGRSAKPYSFMIGDTKFNSDLAKAEHLMIEDENASHDIRSRRKFGTSIKEFTVNKEMRIHGKGLEAITLPTFKRLTSSGNSEAENLMILPPMDDSILDKIILFKCGPTTLSNDRKKNWKQLAGELPQLAHHLLQMKIPKAMQDARFGVRAYHNPELMEILNAVSPEHRLLSLIDEILWTGKPDAAEIDQHRLTAEQLEQKLRNSTFGFAVEKLLYFSSACGVYLARLASKYPDRFEQRKTQGKTVWLIQRPKQTN